MVCVLLEELTASPREKPHHQQRPSSLELPRHVMDDKVELLCNGLVLLCARILRARCTHRRERLGV